MRNTPKSESLLRARAEREERTGSSEHPAGGAPNPGGGLVVVRAGGTQRTAPTIRSARSELSTHARAVGKYARGDSILIAIEAAASSGCGGTPSSRSLQRTTAAALPKVRGVATTVELSECALST